MATDLKTDEPHSHTDSHRVVGPIMRVFRNRTAGYALLAFCAAGFITLALLAVFAESLLLVVDEPVQRWVIDHRTGVLNDVMKWTSFLGTRWVIGGALLGVAAYSLLTGRCRVTLLILVIAFALNPLVEVLLKEVLIDRSRPDVLPLGRGRGASFPSGHVMAAIGFYGMLPALVSEATGRYRARIAAFLAAGVIIVAVGFSRIYMGVHWLTDVLGGFLIGAVVILSTYEALQGHRLDRNRCEGCPPEDRELQGWLAWRIRAPSRAP